MVLLYSLGNPCKFAHKNTRNMDTPIRKCFAISFKNDARDEIITGIENYFKKIAHTKRYEKLFLSTEKRSKEATNQLYILKPVNEDFSERYSREGQQIENEFLHFVERKKVEGKIVDFVAVESEMVAHLLAYGLAE